MGIHAVPNPRQDSPASRLHLIGGREFTGEDFGMELPRYAAGSDEEDRPLGCIRGIAVACAIQAALAILALAIWKLPFHFL
jgi:hypothetical protein